MKLFGCTGSAQNAAQTERSYLLSTLRNENEALGHETYILVSEEDDDDESDNDDDDVAAGAAAAADRDEDGRVVRFGQGQRIKVGVSDESVGGPRHRQPVSSGEAIRGVGVAEERKKDVRKRKRKALKKRVRKRVWRIVRTSWKYFRTGMATYSTGLAAMFSWGAAFNQPTTYSSKRPTNKYY